MLRATHKFFLTLYGDSGAVLDRREVTSFLPVYEDLRFLAVRSGQMPNDGTSSAVRLEPWMRNDKLAGVAAALDGIEKRYTLSIFSHDICEALVARKLLEEDKEAKPEVRWKLETEKLEEPDPAPPGRLRISLSREPYPFRDGQFAPALQWESPENAADRHHGVEVAVSSPLLEELRRATAGSLDIERADVLTGDVLREPDGRILVVVRGRIPVDTDTTSSKAHVSFSPLTFHAVRRENLRRGDGQVICGWHHNHPPPCGRDCAQVVPACKTDSVFLSTADHNVFRSSFAMPYMIGLVSGKGEGKRTDEPIVRAYGWNDAGVSEMNFSIFEE